MAGGFLAGKWWFLPSVTNRWLPQVTIATTNQLTFFNQFILRIQVTATLQLPFYCPSFISFFIFTLTIFLPSLINFPSQSHLLLMAKWASLISLPKYVVGFCLLLHVLNLQTPAMAADDDEDDYVEVDSSGYGGYSGGVSEQCDTDLRSFLPPPYGNLTNVICKPIWNTFVLRVCLIWSGIFGLNTSSLVSVFVHFSHLYFSICTLWFYLFQYLYIQL